MPDSLRALLFVAGCGAAFVVAGFSTQHGVSMPAATVPAVAGAVGLAFLLFHADDVARERKAKGL
jgi:hypothetical protein